MSNDTLRLQLTGRDEAHTEALGRRLGEALREILSADDFGCEQTDGQPGRQTGIVLGLIGDLGAGKTCWTRGVAAGLGLDPRDIASPTFVYLVTYEEGPVGFVHCDLYRLADTDPGQREQAFESIGLFDAFAEPVVTCVEWWDCYNGPPPPRVVRCEFLIDNDGQRRISVTFEGQQFTGDLSGSLPAEGPTPALELELLRDALRSAGAEA